MKDTAISNLPRSLAIGVLYSLVLFAAGLFFVLGVDLVFPPDATERELIQKLRLSDGYAPLASVIGVIFLSFVALPIGSITALFASVISRRVN